MDYRKPQDIADYVMTITLKGRQPEQIQRVYDDAAPVSRKRINKRTGKPFTVFGPLSKITGSRHDWIATCEVTRVGVIGNFQNDVEQFFRESAARLRVTVIASADHIRRFNIRKR